MASVGTTTVDPYAQRRDQMFPALSDRQIASITRLGTRRRMRRGELLFDQGDVRRPVLRRPRGRDRDRPAAPRAATTRSRAPDRVVHGRDQHAHRPPEPGARRARSRTARCWRSVRDTLADARADRPRAERAAHARVHPAAGQPDRARLRRRGAGRLAALAAARSALREFLDAQRPSVHLRRRRARPDVAGAARPVRRRMPTRSPC